MALEPGEHTILSADPYPFKDGYRIDWSIRLHSGKLIEKQTQMKGPLHKTKLRARAKKKAADMLVTAGTVGTWKPGSSLIDYIDQVAIPALDESSLSTATKDLYNAAFRNVTNRCSATHRHKDSLDGFSIGDGLRFAALKRCLREVSTLHGLSQAKQARKAVTKFVIHPLMDDEVIGGDPLAGRDLDLESCARERVGKRRSGIALSRGKYNRIVDHLLTLDGTEVAPPKRGRWTVEQMQAARKNAVDLTLLQAVTGLRIGEAVTLIWDDVGQDSQGRMTVPIREEKSKTHKSRKVPIFDDEVSARLMDRYIQGATWVIDSPTDRGKPWHKTTAKEAVRVLYVELAETLGIPELAEDFRSHSWRTTLNSNMLATVPEAIRAATLGHTTGVNRKSYTDMIDTDPWVAGGQALRQVRPKTTE
ncbi:MAG: tyrosine-type recombinase/integrase [Corynebacterium sp.]|uniref:tyrosine-type recombinase/integrase n=1 Tax=Corynebacterium sp. TaxID=1720 RepID=UPI003F105E15